MQQNSNYPLSDQFSLGFSPYEDRLLLSAHRPQFGQITLLLTRRMVVLIIKQLLSKLPDLSGLQQTPHAYWQEVLQMAHQKAVAENASGNKPAATSGESAIGGSVPASDKSGVQNDKKQATEATELYLATELTSELREGRLLLAFKGLPVPEAMRKPCQHEPVVAFTFEPEQVHQFLELLIAKTTEAHWHLPLDLPWLEPLNSAGSAKTTSH